MLASFHFFSVPAAPHHAEEAPDQLPRQRGLLLPFSLIHGGHETDEPLLDVEAELAALGGAAVDDLPPFNIVGRRPARRVRGGSGAAEAVTGRGVRLDEFLEELRIDLAVVVGVAVAGVARGGGFLLLFFFVRRGRVGTRV